MVSLQLHYPLDAKGVPSSKKGRFIVPVIHSLEIDALDVINSPHVDVRWTLGEDLSG
jgi:hypothetical protein